MVWKTKVRWFSDKKTSEKEWTHTYINSLGDVVKCLIVDSEEPITVLNENGCTLHNLKITDLEKI
jgi:hypothetical protein